MEEHNEKKSKKVMGILCAVGVIAAFTTFANSSSNSTSSSRSAAHTQGNSTYFQKVEYHVGSTAPYDDAYIHTEAATVPVHMRQTYYYFAGHRNEQHSYPGFGSNMLSISDGYEYPRHDTATGNCYSKVYTGNSLNSSLMDSAYLYVK